MRKSLKISPSDERAAPHPSGSPAPTLAAEMTNGSFMSPSEPRNPQNAVVRSTLHFSLTKRPPKRAAPPVATSNSVANPPPAPSESPPPPTPHSPAAPPAPTAKAKSSPATPPAASKAPAPPAPPESPPPPPRSIAPVSPKKAPPAPCPHPANHHLCRFSLEGTSVSSEENYKRINPPRPPPAPRIENGFWSSSCGGRFSKKVGRGKREVWGRLARLTVDFDVERPSKAALRSREKAFFGIRHTIVYGRLVKHCDMRPECPIHF